MKRCSKCEKEKALSDFPLRKSSRDGHHGWCRPCYRSYYTKAMRRWREKNPERALELQRKTYELNREAINARGREWRAKNRDRVNRLARERRKKNPEAFREAYERWRQKNYEAEKIRVATRRALCKDTPELRIFIGQLLSEPCAYCGALDNITIDHVMPLSRGGKHEPANLVAACYSCNSSKGARTPDEWPGPPSTKSA